jgi:hypothetical protein
MSFKGIDVHESGDILIKYGKMNLIPNSHSIKISNYEKLVIIIFLMPQTEIIVTVPLLMKKIEKLFHLLIKIDSCDNMDFYSYHCTFSAKFRFV